MRRQLRPAVQTALETQGAPGPGGRASAPYPPALQPPVAACGAAATPDPSACFSRDRRFWQRWFRVNRLKLQSRRATNPENPEYRLDPLLSDTAAPAQGDPRVPVEPVLPPLVQCAPSTLPPVRRLPEENPTVLAGGCRWGWLSRIAEEPASFPAL